MQLTIAPVQVISRVLAVLLVAVPLGFLALAIDRGEQEVIRKLSHQELLEYLRVGEASSFSEQYLYLVVISLLLLALVEVVAWVVRLGLGLIRPNGAVIAAQPADC